MAKVRSPQERIVSEGYRLLSSVTRVRARYLDSAEKAVCYARHHLLSRATEYIFPKENRTDVRNIVPVGSEK